MRPRRATEARVLVHSPHTLCIVNNVFSIPEAANIFTFALQGWETWYFLRDWPDFLKVEVYWIYTQKLFSYFRENTMPTHCEAQSVTVVWRKGRCFYCVSWKEHKNGQCRQMESYLVLHSWYFWLWPARELISGPNLVHHSFIHSFISIQP